MAGSLQVLIEGSGASPLVAGLPPALRAAYWAATELAPAKVVFCGADPDFETRYRRQLASLAPIPAPSANGQAPKELFAADSPLLVLGQAGFPERGALTRFVSQAGQAAKPVRWLQDGAAVAAYFPRASQILDGAANSTELAANALRAPGSFAELPSAPAWLSAHSEEAARRAEDAFCASLGHSKDGYLARFDRKISVAVSRLLLKTPVTPDNITTASLALGLYGAWLLASGSHLSQFLGSLVLWACCILDGCDGEVARLKLLCSKSGAAYDIWADEVAHLATFVAIPFGVHRMFPQASFLLPGILLVSGVSICGLAVWYFVLRLPEDRRGPNALLVERIASRDYVYLLVVLAALGRLDWFLWAAGFGSHVFYLTLWRLSRSKTG